MAVLKELLVHSFGEVALLLCNPAAVLTNVCAKEMKLCMRKASVAPEYSSSLIIETKKLEIVL